MKNPYKTHPIYDELDSEELHEFRNRCIASDQYFYDNYILKFPGNEDLPPYSKEAFFEFQKVSSEKRGLLKQKMRRAGFKSDYFQGLEIKQQYPLSAKEILMKIIDAEDTVFMSYWDLLEEKSTEPYPKDAHTKISELHLHTVALNAKYLSGIDPISMGSKGSVRHNIFDAPKTEAVDDEAGQFIKPSEGIKNKFMLEAAIRFDGLTNSERVILMDGYCKGCGAIETKCICNEQEEDKPRKYIKRTTSFFRR